MSLSAMMDLVKRWLLEAWAQGHAEGYTAGFMDGAEVLPRCMDCGAEVPRGQGLLFRGNQDVTPFCELCVAKRLTGCFRRP